MSAWMVSDAHIDLIASAYIALVDPAADPQEIGDTLLDANVMSIHARYVAGDIMTRQGRAQAARYSFLAWPADLNTAWVCKAIVCLDYQSCEFTGWKASRANGFLDELRAKVPAWDRIKGRTDIPWGIDDHPCRTADAE